MEFAISIAGYVVGLPLELLIIAALLHGGYRRFPGVFAYVIAEFLSTVIEMPQALAWYRTHDILIGNYYATWYWRDEFALQVLVLIVVIDLIWSASSAARSRRMIRSALLIGIVFFIGISFLIHYDPAAQALHRPGKWLTPWARDLNFGAAILDMVLWAMLIAKRQKDSRVLMLSAGLGIMFTGEAIGESMRTLSSSAVTAGGILMIVTNFAFNYIWWQTFRAPRAVLVSDPKYGR